jgi:hypothetical protein
MFFKRREPSRQYGAPGQEQCRTFSDEAATDVIRVEDREELRTAAQAQDESSHSPSDQPSIVPSGMEEAPGIGASRTDGTGSRSD